MPQRRQPIDWEAVKREIQAGESQNTVAKRHGIARQTLAKRGKREGWLNDEARWLRAARQTQTTKRLENPQSLSDKAIATRGNRTPETQAAILCALQEGMGMTQAALANGISYDTLLAWRKDDPSFDQLCQQARHSLLGEMQKVIPQAARRGDWKAAESYLKTAPETRGDWASGPGGGGGITVNISVREDKLKQVTIDGTRLDSGNSLPDATRSSSDKAE
jgi:transposase-like protein